MAHRLGNDEFDIVTPPPPTVTSSLVPEHVMHCWFDPSGPGFQFKSELKSDLKLVKDEQKEVRKDVVSLRARLWYICGGLAVLGAIGLSLLGVWMTSVMNASERNAVKRDDIEQLFRMRYRAEEQKRIHDSYDFDKPMPLAHPPGKNLQIAE